MRWMLIVAVCVCGGRARAFPEDIGGAGGLLPDSGGWAEATPDAELLARAADAAAYSKKRAGLALIVVKGDAIVFEEAENGFDLERAHHIWSGTKTFTCALAAAAEADGRFTLASTLGETFALTDRRAPVSVHDLLSLTSGLSESSMLAGDFLAKRPQVPDKEAFALREITASTPIGERFRYAASAFVMFSALARKALGEDPLAYLDRRVLQPIGFRYGDWLRDGAGSAWFSFGAFTTARSWARFGMLLRDDGVFRGQRILPAGALAKCFTGTAAMPAYGIGVWLNREVPGGKKLWIPPAFHGRFASDGPILLPGGPEDLVAAAGYNDNRLYVVPSRGLVIVRFGRGHARFEDDALLGRLLGRQGILPRDGTK